MGKQFHDGPPNAKLNSRPHAEERSGCTPTARRTTVDSACAGAELRCPDGLCEKRLSACPQQGNADLSSDESDVKEISGKFSRRNWRVQILLMRAKKSLGVAGKGASFIRADEAAKELLIEDAKAAIARLDRRPKVSELVRLCQAFRWQTNVVLQLPYSSPKPPAAPWGSFPPKDDEFGNWIEDRFLGSPDLLPRPNRRCQRIDPAHERQLPQS